MPRIGPYTLHALETGRFALDGGAMFGIIPKPLWERRIAPDTRNRIPMHMRCLLLESSDRLILIDNGLGTKYDRKFADIYAVDDTDVNLRASLEAAGFGPADVTDVILTHLHFDHCGGSTHREGDRLHLVFENARHYVQRSHWEWAHASVREKASFLPENLDPLEASGQLHLVEGEDELFPGLDLLVMNGHTEAQQLVRITGPEGTLVFVADLLPTTAHIPLPWVMAYDVRPLVTMDEKQRFLDRAIAEKWTLFFEHDPDTVIADAVVEENRFCLGAPRPLDDF